MDEIAAVSDLCYVISRGKVVAAGTPGDLARDESKLVRQFMRGEPDGPVPFHYPAQDYAQELLGKG